MDRSSTRVDAVAIVGIGCRFPGAHGPDGFWELLRCGKDEVRDIPPARSELVDSDLMTSQARGVRQGAFLDDVAGFDWQAFAISPREAKFMDPQQRLLLEVAWEALEDAGIPVYSLGGSATSVFVGIMWNDYAKLQMSGLDGYSVGGGSLAFAANRISHVFDLNGPSMSIDVSCASSLVAVHQACQSISTGESTLAIAGGVNLMLAPDTTRAIAKAGILSPDGRCKTFDANADGFVRGEGAGLVILKPLSRAVEDGDRIYATIRATAVFHSGRSEWIMAPSLPIQERMLRSAYARAGVDAAHIDFIELHGTGTKKGDPIEAQALGAVIGSNRDSQHPCIVGSVKTNIGHLDSAAGIAGLIKTALAIHHREIPPSLHLHQVNPDIDLAALGLAYASSLRPWPQTKRLPLAGVTGLSFGGGNAHIVLEGVAKTGPSHVGAHPVAIVPLSAHSPAALLELAQRYRQLLRDQPEVPPSIIGAAAGRRRTHHRCRVAFVADSRDALAAQIDAFVAKGPSKAPRRRKNPPKIVFAMSADGVARWADLGRDLLRMPGFRAEVERCDAIVRRLASWSIVEQLCADSDAAPPPQRLEPALWALHAGLACLWRSWGLAPEAVVGHGVGELSAAQFAGVLSREDAARIAIARGRVLQAVTRGPNSEHPCDPAQLLESTRRLEDELQGVAFTKPTMRFVSTIASPISSAPAYGLHHWSRHIHAPVRFCAAIEQLQSEGCDVFIELGPHPLPADALSNCLQARAQNAVSVSSMRRDEAGHDTMLRALAVLYIFGCDIDWRNVAPDCRGYVPMPMYPWQRQRMWLT